MGVTGGDGETLRGAIAGQFEDDGEAVLDRLEAKYRAMAERTPTP